VDPRVGLDDVEKRKFLTPPGLEFRHFGRPARSQSLYRLRYPGSHTVVSNQSCLMYVCRYKECDIREHIKNLSLQALGQSVLPS
jgi:hypothetical protein